MPNQNTSSFQANTYQSALQGHTHNVVAIDNPKDVIDTYRRSFELARQANFDGVELLAQGYVILNIK